MRDRAGIACTLGLLTVVCSCGPGLEPPSETAGRTMDGNPAASDADADAKRPDAGSGDDGLDAGAESDHTNGDAPED